MRRILRVLGACAFLPLLTAACAAAPSEDADTGEQFLGPAGVEFVTVPVPGQDCDSIVLKGTRRFQKRAYVLPQAYVGVDASSKPLFEIIPNSDGSYAVRLGVFFPGGRGDQANRASTNRHIQKDCSYARIREVVNASSSAAEQIGDPSPLVVNYIKAKMPGTEGVAMVGHEGSDILSYVGQDSIFEFKIGSETALRDFVTRLRGNVGVQLDFDFVFTAQTSDTFEASVDFSANADKLDAAFAAGVPLDGLMVDAEFRARIARAMQTMNIELYVESNNEAFRQFADRVVEKMILDNPNLQIRPPALPEGLPNNSQQNQPPADGQPQQTQAAPALIKINVRSAVEALKAQGNYRITLTNIGEVASRTYTAHTVIRSNFTEPGVSELALYSDDTGSIFTEDIRSGTSFYLVPSGRATEDIEYHYRSTTFRRQEDLFAAEHNMKARFSLLNQHEGDVRYPSDGDAFMYDGWAINVFNWSFYTWGMQTLTRDYHNRQFQRLDVGAINTLNQVGVTFSRVGRPYTFAQLPQETDLFEATLDANTNRVLVKAKTELGRLKLENKETFTTVSHPANSQAPLYERRYYQDYWSSFGNWKSREVSSVGQPLQLPAQRSAVYVKVIPERGDQLHAINQNGISVGPREQNGVLHPPPVTPDP